MAQANKTAKLWILCCFAILSGVLIGCTLHQVEVQGTIVTYSSVDLGHEKLAYTIDDSQMNSIAQGQTDISPDGKFTIKVAGRIGFPYFVHLWGFANTPPDSVSGRTYVEVKSEKDRRIAIGTVYLYRSINILGNDSKGPTKLEDLDVQWHSDVPDVDFYRIELLYWRPNSVGQSVAMAVLLKHPDVSAFSFQDVAMYAGKIGRYDVGGQEVAINSAPIEGNYVLSVDAIRVIAGTPEVVAVSTFSTVTIVKGDRSQ